ncbi:FtsX-like permease family protein [Roseivirga misakiensis]|uniref:ABC transporter permease n=1 Tax=Roseivirga misakiensis TaxID=1563681 RepID=A0A1E5SYJ5_9BACT|nr:FtsX-like permease family protein [Roseivirga misakiensis]OEK04186.1 hypothetical protein BFP71_11930 [Roseivirga misakiensis]
MLRQTIKFSFRSFRKTKWLHGLNVLGLTLGLSVFLLSALYVYQEGTYEMDFTNRDRVYEVAKYWGQDSKFAKLPSNLVHVLEDQPEIEAMTSFRKIPNTDIYVDKDVYENQRVIWADSTFFDVFDFELLVGNPETVLNNPDVVVIDEKTAKRIYGTLDVLGKEFRYVQFQDKFKTVTIGGVSRTPHYKTQLAFDFLIAKKRSPFRADGWFSAGDMSYVVLKENVSLDQLNDRLLSISEEYVFPGRQDTDVLTFGEWKERGSYHGFFAQPLNSLRDSEGLIGEIMPKADVKRTRTTLFIGIAALLIAIINFVNLSTARASQRMKEVGLKRILGSTRKQLTGQFLLESFVVILISVTLSLGVVEAFIKWQPLSFGGFVEYSVLHSPEWVLGLVAFVVLLTLFSGIYPALYLSSGKVIALLNNGKGQSGFGIYNAELLRKGATVLQFTFSIGLIAAVLTMFAQISHLRDIDLGYDQDQVIVINNPQKLKDKEVFKSELARVPGVASAAYTFMTPNNPEGQTGRGVWDLPDGTKFDVAFLQVDATYFETLGIEFIVGENFNPSLSESRKAQNENLIINQAAVKAFELGDDPVGKALGNGIVRGVVQDFVFNGLKDEVEPLIIQQKIPVGFDPWWHHPLTVRISGRKIDDVIPSIKALWSEMSSLDMKWYPLSTSYESLVQAEERSFNTILMFSVFAVLVSCIGLFGLAIFTIDDRVKEFGIRKVLGASVPQIMRHFGWGFTKLIAVAFVIAIPLSIYLLNGWLSDFSRRIEISYEIPLLTALLTLLITAVTLISQSLKAGRLNPVDTLRNE